jgi:hypothetical protein
MVFASLKSYAARLNDDIPPMPLASSDIEATIHKVQAVSDSNTTYKRYWRTKNEQ